RQCTVAPPAGTGGVYHEGERTGSRAVARPGWPTPRRRTARLLDWRVRVALNAQLLSFAHSYRGGGISRVIYHQLRVLRSLESQFRFVAFVPDLPPDPALAPTPAFRLSRAALPTELPLARVVWEQLVQPLELRRWRADL